MTRHEFGETIAAVGAAGAIRDSAAYDKAGHALLAEFDRLTAEVERLRADRPTRIERDCGCVFVVNTGEPSASWAMRSHAAESCRVVAGGCVSGPWPSIEGAYLVDATPSAEDGGNEPGMRAFDVIRDTP